MPPGVGVFSSGARVLHVLLVGIWLGAGGLAILMGYLVPETLDSQQAAARVLSEVRAHLDTYGVLAGPLALVTLVVGWAPQNMPLRLRVIMTLTATGAAAFSRQYLVPKLREVMNAMGRPLEDLPAADPLVSQYLDLATVSQGALMLEVAAALVLTVTAASASKPKRSYGGLEL